MTNTPYDSILPTTTPSLSTQKEDTVFSYEDLGLIRRVLDFAVAQIGISDALGNKIYPKTETRRRALQLIDSLEADGIVVPAGLYTPFDPYDIQDKIATARWFDEDKYEHSIKGLITGVSQDPDTERWEIRFGKTVYDYADRAAVNDNVFVDLVDNQ